MKRFVDWINKVWGHNRDKVGDYGIRSLIHIPIGIFMGLFDWNRALIQLFKEYQTSEDKWCADQSWKDYNGAMVGWVIGRIGLIVGVILIIKWLQQ